MPTTEQIRQLCSRVVTAQGEDFERTLLELSNAIDTYSQGQDKIGNKAAKAKSQGQAS